MVQRTSVRRWPVGDEPCGVSVTGDHNVLVACNKARKIREFSSDGAPVRQLPLPADVDNVWHAIQLCGGGGEFVVSHGLMEPVHRVCRVSADARSVLQVQCDYS